MTQETRYAAYLIRWQEGNDPNQWRAFAENAYTGEKISFTNKERLIHFLWQSLHGDTSPPTLRSGHSIEPQTCTTPAPKS